ncbi:hypothetical protein Aduo_017250 [Ancylostoma duodenale]
MLSSLFILLLFYRGTALRTGIQDGANATQQNTTTMNSTLSRNRRSAPFFPLHRNIWSLDKTISYVFDPIHDEDMKQLVRKAFQFWEDNTCLTFEENGPNTPVLNITRAGGCWSSLGLQLGKESQTISLNEDCAVVGAIIHEIAHALSVDHTMTRPDRNRYIDIDFRNVLEQNHYNFIKLGYHQSSTKLAPYDYGSIMQYSQFAFGVDESLPVMFAKYPDYQKTMGSLQPSFTDVITMNRLYKCQERFCPSVRAECLNGGIVDSRSCSHCLCPAMFTGSKCEMRNRGRGPQGKCGASLKADFKWHSFRIRIGDEREDVHEAYECFWLFTAPLNRRVQIRVDWNEDCFEECGATGIELFIHGFATGGVKICCEDDSERKVFTSRGEVAAAHVYTMSGFADAKISYRFV